MTTQPGQRTTEDQLVNVSVSSRCTTRRSPARMSAWNRLIISGNWNLAGHATGSCETNSLAERGRSSRCRLSDSRRNRLSPCGQSLRNSRGSGMGVVRMAFIVAAMLVPANGFAPVTAS